MGNEMNPEDTLISVNPRYKSSTRIDGAEDYRAFVDDFIIHGTAINTLETLFRTFTQSRQRTFTLTGPYGSGKSTLALFLSSLLSQNADERDYISEKIRKFEQLQSLVLELHSEKGWKVIKHVCGLTSPAQSILKSLILQTNTKIKDLDVESKSDADCLEIIKSIFNKKNQMVWFYY
jgi:DNA replication protein DnaC